MSNGLDVAKEALRLWRGVRGSQSVYYQCQRLSGFYMTWAYQGHERGIITYGDAYQAGNASSFFIDADGDVNDPSVGPMDEIFYSEGEFDHVVTVIGRDLDGRVLVLNSAHSGDRLIDLGNDAWIDHADSIPFDLRGVSRANGANAHRAGVSAYILNIGGGSAAPGGDVQALAEAVIRGEYGNGDERKRRLGDRYAEVQARVNQILDGGGAPAPAPDIEALAQAVIRGDYGNGQERVDKLGDLYGPVQARVNEILNAQPLQPSIDELAQAVIRGEYGNGQERVNRLGALYGEVQARVNEILG